MYQNWNFRLNRMEWIGHSNWGANLFMKLVLFRNLSLSHTHTHTALPISILRTIYNWVIYHIKLRIKVIEASPYVLFKEKKWQNNELDFSARPVEISEFVRRLQISFASLKPLKAIKKKEWNQLSKSLIRQWKFASH